MRPDWWNRLHDDALAALTTEWQSLSDLKRTHRMVALDDLVVAKAAERRVDRTTDRNGRPNGCAIFYRLPA